MFSIKHLQGLPLGLVSHTLGASLIIIITIIVTNTYWLCCS